jgi:NAD(P)H-dependent FMN reductase
VSYGGVSGGLRAVQIEKQTLTTLKMVPIVEAVTIPMVSQHLDAGGKFVAKEVHTTSAAAMLNELVRWAEALRPLRHPSA